MDVQIDEQTLKQVAEVSGGEYFRATDSEKLHKIYQQIDRMEKTKIEVKKFKRYRELYAIPLFLGFLFMIAAIFFEYVVVRPIP
jgi:Ca-activated chloride channel family protein